MLACALATLAAGATFREHLDILGLKPGASEKDITQAYRRASAGLDPTLANSSADPSRCGERRRQALKWHPDKNSAPDARERFTRIAEAYEVRGSPQAAAPPYSPL